MPDSAFMQWAKAPTPGKHNPVARAHDIWVAVTRTSVRARRFQRIPDRLEIASAIIDQRDGLATSQRSLGRRNRVGLARINLDRLPQRAGQRLVAAFDDMVVVRAVQIFDVQRDAGGSSQSYGTNARSVRYPIRPAGACQRRLPHKIGPPRNIERTAGQRLIHRRISRAVTRDPALFAQRLEHASPMAMPVSSVV